MAWLAGEHCRRAAVRPPGGPGPLAQYCWPSRKTGEVPCSDDYLCELFTKFGLSEFQARTAQLLVRRPLAILLILVVALLVARLGSRVVRRSVSALVARSAPRGTGARAETRAKTLGGVAASLVRIVVWTLALVLVIDQLGFNVGPLLAGASVVGVAVGFGAQSLVRDFLSGFFILAEDQFGVGDSITVSDVTGTVEELNLRVTRLRASDGTVWFVPNGEIRKVGNSAKDWARAIVDVTVGPSADLGRANRVISDEVAVFAADQAWAGIVLEAPELLGVESVGSSGIVVRVAVKTAPRQRSKVARELRARVSARLRAEGLGVAEPPAPSVSPADPES